MMRASRNIWFYIAFLSASLLFLILEHLTHFEFLLHLAAIPLEVLLAVFIVEKLLEKRETKERRRQLMFIKSYLFRSEMRNLFIANFKALKSPSLSLSIIKEADLEELREVREKANIVEYQTPEALEPVVLEYVKAEKVWHDFKERAITYDFQDIFEDMIYILHFIYDVKHFKEANPGRLFVEQAIKNEALMKKTMKVLGDGIRKFLDYALELREKQPEMFYSLLSDYELSAQAQKAAGSKG